MAKRRKKPVSKILTYGELDARTTRAPSGERFHDFEAALYRNVRVEPYAIGAHWFVIHWRGNLRAAGGPDKEVSVVLAQVYALHGGATGYVVPGVGKVSNKTPIDKAMARIWRKYVGVFTPHDPKHRLPDRQHAVYRLLNGVVTPWRWSSTGRSPEGCWLTLPTCNRPKPSLWAKGVTHRKDFTNFPKFRARSTRFARDLKKSLADGPTAVMQYLLQSECTVTAQFLADGVDLQVCLPPTRTTQGKRLVVRAAMHTQESRQYFHVDGDYTPRHSQYMCWEHGTPRMQLMRWKCGKEALIGIKEWVLSSIHIPGPEM